ncbi:MAG: hypothetical protein LJE69_13110, partial [Thiohalocapsa sp.]|nr:hypothetical protein [Thiohalocapsa sp.]
MNEARRLQYLEAMGIDVWRPRAAGVAPVPLPAAAERLPATEQAAAAERTMAAERPTPEVAAARPEPALPEQAAPAQQPPP